FRLLPLDTPAAQSGRAPPRFSTFAPVFLHISLAYEQCLVRPFNLCSDLLRNCFAARVRLSLLRLKTHDFRATGIEQRNRQRKADNRTSLVRAHRSFSSLQSGADGRLRYQEPLSSPLLQL